MQEDCKCPEVVPDFFIVGAAKAATTSLAAWLSQHPGVHLPPHEKEPGFFCDSVGYDDPAKYSSLYASADPGQLKLDASTAYLSDPASSSWIGQCNPSAKIIISLRNPAERAFSLYLQMLKAGHENLDSFEDAVDAEFGSRKDLVDGPPTPGNAHNYMYFHSGLYAAQVARYLEVFPREQILILMFEDIVRRPIETLGVVTGFLGIQPLERVHAGRKNPAQVPRKQSVQHFLKRQVVDRCDAAIESSTILGKPARYLKVLAYRAMKWNLTTENMPTLSPQLRTRFLNDYRDDIRETEALTGLGLTRAWLGDE